MNVRKRKGAVTVVSLECHRGGQAQGIWEWVESREVREEECAGQGILCAQLPVKPGGNLMLFQIRRKDIALAEVRIAADIACDGPVSANHLATRAWSRDKKVAGCRILNIKQAHSEIADCTGARNRSSDPRI